MEIEQLVRQQRRWFTQMRWWVGGVGRVDSNQTRRGKMRGDWNNGGLSCVCIQALPIEHKSHGIGEGGSRVKQKQ